MTPESVVRKVAAFIPVSTEVLNPPEPTTEQVARWRAEEQARLARIAQLQQAHARRVAEAQQPLSAILELHAPVTPEDDYLGNSLVCEGCDGDGYGYEPPAWPCRTYQLAIGEEVEV